MLLVAVVVLPPNENEGAAVVAVEPEVPNEKEGAPVGAAAAEVPNRDGAEDALVVEVVVPNENGLASLVGGAAGAVGCCADAEPKEKPDEGGAEGGAVAGLVPNEKAGCFEPAPVLVAEASTPLAGLNEKSGFFGSSCGAVALLVVNVAVGWDID